MAPQVSSLAQREPKGPYIPTELILVIFEQISGSDWPEMWFVIRAVCRTWKVEIEKLFMKRYLQTMTMVVFSNVGLFEYVVKAVPGERAVAELDPERAILTAESLIDMEVLTTAMTFEVLAPEIGIFGLTELGKLVDWRIGTEGDKILVRWLPMVNELFKRVLRHSIARERASFHLGRKRDHRRKKLQPSYR